MYYLKKKKKSCFQSTQLTVLTPNGFIIKFLTKRVSNSSTCTLLMPTLGSWRQADLCNRAA